MGLAKILPNVQRRLNTNTPQIINKQKNEEYCPIHFMRPHTLVLKLYKGSTKEEN